MQYKIILLFIILINCLTLKSNLYYGTRTKNPKSIQVLTISHYYKTID